MALDGIAVSGIVHELNQNIINGRIDKVYQPEKDEIVILLRGNGQNLRLLMTCNATHPRLHFTKNNKDNPMKAPMFCMVLRKHLSGGRILSVTQPNFERIVNIELESLDEMGDLTKKTLIIEIMGKHSNIILIDKNNIILDSIKHVSHDTSSVREVLPGKEYVLPPSQDKLNPLETDISDFCVLAKNNPDVMVQQFIFQKFTGISPVSASEIAFRAGIEASRHLSELSESETNMLAKTFCETFELFKSGNYKFEIYKDKTNKLTEFSAFPLTMLQADSELTSLEFDTISELLEYFYVQKDSTSRIGQKSHDMRKLVQLNIERCVKKRDIQQKTLKDIENRDKYRLYGELITSNVYQIEKGAKSFTTINFYDENMAEITIPLDSEKTPSENAQKYFKRYNKEKRTFEALKTQIAQNDEELLYLEGVLSSIQSSTSESDIEEIHEELADQGFAKRKKQVKGAPKKKASQPLQFKSSDGFAIYVGKNNKQNDELTLKFAASDDIWLHTKDIPGSHVIIKTDSTQIPDKTIEEAAMLAAYFSKAKTSSLVPVDYTQRRNVKKPNGSKPGFVIYEHNKTAYVTPDETLINNFLQTIYTETK